MITKKQLKRERTPNKVITKIEEKRKDDVLNSEKQVRRLVGQSIFPTKRKYKW